MTRADKQTDTRGQVVRVVEKWGFFTATGGGKKACCGASAGAAVRILGTKLYGAREFSVAEIHGEPGSFRVSATHEAAR